MRLLSLTLAVALACAYSLAACGGTAERDALEPDTGATATGGSSGQPTAGAASDATTAGTPSGGDSTGAPLTDLEVRLLLIDESIAAYEGACPCPYSIARDGTECGARSAYSREGGAAPLCFPEDVTDEVVQGWRDEHAEL